MSAYGGVRTRNVCMCVGGGLKQEMCVCVGGGVRCTKWVLTEH